MTQQRFDQSTLRDYYGKVLQKTSDLKTGACCCSDDQLSPAVIQRLMVAMGSVSIGISYPSHFYYRNFQFDKGK
jgi:hypothetical protein